MSANHVSGSELSFMDALKAGVIPKPPLVPWNGPDGFQAWRRKYGKRPSVAVDGYTTTATQESSFWRSSMEHLYGTNWGNRLVEEEAPIEEGVQTDDGGLAIAIAGTPPPRRTAASPGSGPPRAATGEPLVNALLPYDSPGS